MFAISGCNPFSKYCYRRPQTEARFRTCGCKPYYPQDSIVIIPQVEKNCNLIFAYFRKKTAEAPCKKGIGTMPEKETPLFGNFFVRGLTGFGNGAIISTVVCETTPCQGGRVQQPSFAETPRRDPLAQLAEHLTFNQGVRSSNLRWVTTFPFGSAV